MTSSPVFIGERKCKNQILSLFLSLSLSLIFSLVSDPFPLSAKHETLFANAKNAVFCRSGQGLCFDNSMNGSLFFFGLGNVL